MIKESNENFQRRNADRNSTTYPHLENQVADFVKKGLLLTPSTVDIKPDENRKEQRTAYRASVGRKWVPGSLTEQIFDELLPTPRANIVNGLDLNNENIANRNKGNLEEAVSKMVVSMLPTPTSNCFKGGAIRSDPTRQSNTLADHFATEPGKTAQLNPRFVAEMMSFPPNWTEVPFMTNPDPIIPFENWDNFPQQHPVCDKSDYEHIDKLKYTTWRNESIKAYGNAVVPELVLQIFKAIDECERLKQF